jgi:hypothetical protein
MRRGYLVYCWYSLLAVMQVLCVSFILTPGVVIWGLISLLLHRIFQD